ncbi:MAG: ABC transporter ATP-binding protein [Neoaquamicrobium sediminum]|uniref:ABC transporter ATP-binding protein n=1 Tax=Neoaquamicrobium sediminum TaxID=1849104 RepID=UPI004034FF14
MSPRTGTQSLLQVRGLTKTFSGITAVNRLDLDVEAGSIVGLIGPNGSGKSTTIDCITGFTPADGGRVLFDGADVSRKSPEALAELGMVRTFQNVRIYEGMSVLDNLVVAARSLRRYPWWEQVVSSRRVSRLEHDLRQEALGHLDLVGIGKYADAPTGILSYGQRKLVAFAMCLMGKPKLIILDEPLAGVNPTVIRRISELIDELNGLGQTFLMIEHNVDFIMRHCAKVVVLEQGQLLTEGPPAAIRTDPRVLEAYLGDYAAHSVEALNA